jgi:hypothetical protein
MSICFFRSCDIIDKKQIFIFIDKDYVMVMGNRVLKVASYAVMLKLVSFIKMSLLMSSQMILWFSAANCIVPLSGAFGGITASVGLFAARQLVHLLCFKTLSLSFLAFSVPGLCASLYWATRHYAIRLLLPVVCMLLFIAHPTGSQVWIYAMYWLIPVAIYFCAQRSLFLQALASTFVAHAVGSVIWLYTMPTTADTWLSLLPIVMCERLLFAGGMVVVFHVMKHIFRLIDGVVVLNWSLFLSRSH